MKLKHFILIILFISLLVYSWLHLGTILPKIKNSKKANDKVLSLPVEDNKQLKRLGVYAKQLLQFSAANKFNTSICFLVDMKVHSGKNRFFVYNLIKDSIVAAGLVAHGSCNQGFLLNPSFSNEKGCGCTSIGKYIVCNPYKGNFGNSFKLKGIDKSNSHAFDRYVVLHAYDCVPDDEIYPVPLCNSLGCPMVSYHFLDKLTDILSKANKPILLYVFN